MLSVGTKPNLELANDMNLELGRFGVKAWTLKLIFDKETQRLIEGQIISDSESPVKEIDTINALILGEKTISDLTTLMCAGNPDLSSEPSLEPIAIAAEQALYNLNSL